MKTDEIIKRAESVSEKYDELIKYTQAYLLHGEGVFMIDNNNVEMDLYRLKKRIICV
jgi:ribonucleoside-diphosphate reductase beta chain